MKVDGCDFKHARPEAKPLLLQTILELTAALDRRYSFNRRPMTIEEWCRFNGRRFWRQFDQHGRE